MQTATRILLVEDDADDQMLFREALTEIHPSITCHVANDGVEAMNFVSQPPPYEMIFLDLKMPFVGGFEVLEWIRYRGREFADIVVIVLTSSPEQRDHARAYQLGARSYLLKPPTRDMLLDILKMLALRPPTQAG